jgi:SAM-dependent methyltransferase
VLDGSVTAGPEGPWPDIAGSYDVVAQEYAAQFRDELDGKPFDRDLLDRFAAALAGQGSVWDIGCGSAGHVTRYLADRGVDAAGVDVSPAVAAVAGQLQPDLEFRVADMRHLPARNGSLAGIVAFYSVIHLPREQVPAGLAEFSRVLAPGGQLLIAMHGGTGEIGTDDWFGRGVPFRGTLVSMTELTAALGAAGFDVVHQHERDPYPGEHASQRLYVWARAGSAARPQASS